MLKNYSHVFLIQQMELKANLKKKPLKPKQITHENIFIHIQSIPVIEV